MARKLLSMDAIRFIIECRNDPSQVYTWQDIADLVQTRFDIKVSGQAVGQSYKKYKNVVIEMNSTNPKSVLEKVLAYADNNNIVVNTNTNPENSTFVSVLVNVLPIVVLVIASVYLFNKLAGSNKDP